MAKLNYQFTGYWNPTAGFRGYSFAANYNYVGDTFYRFYLDGSAAPAFTPLTISGTQRVTGLQFNIAEGLYVLEYKDDNGEITIGKFWIKDSPVDTCYPEFTLTALGFYTVYLTESKFGLFVNIGSWPAHTIAEMQVAGAHSSSIDNGSIYKNDAYAGSGTVSTVTEWTNSELSALNVGSLIDELRIRRNSDSCVDTVAYEINLLEEFSVLSATYSSTDLTAAGADDGTIVIAVTGGSGNYSFVWDDGPTTQNRSGLPIGVYSVTITDDITLEEVILSGIQINGPLSPVIIPGTILRVPLLNSLHFVVDPIVPDGINTFQGLDNVLLADQIFPNHVRGKYWQKVCKVDRPPVQFHSDFSAHEASIYNCDGELQLSYAILLKEQLIGKIEDLPILIQNHTIPGSSRVYFASGNQELLLEVGEGFKVLNNADGFDGDYNIADVALDETGNQYFLITLNYNIASPQSSATGRFNVTDADYNVFEFTVDPSILDDGDYYVKIRAYDPVENGGEKFAYSEPILLKVSHPGTNKISYRNIDNGMDIVWTTGYEGFKRVEGLFSPKRFPGGDKSTSRNSSFDLITVTAKKKRSILFETVQLPGYLHEALSCIFDLDFKSVNGVEVDAEEEYGQPSYPAYQILGSSSIMLETPWFDQHNNHDVGSVNEGSFIVDESGFIKST